MTVHTFEVYPTVEDLNEVVGRASLARLSMFIDEAGADSRVNVAISGGTITTSLLPPLLPFVGDVDWSRVRAWLVDERYVPVGNEDRNDDQTWEGFLHAASGVEFIRMPTSDTSAPGADSLDEATAAFADTWREPMGEGPFDTALTGMDPDRYTRSLLPGRVSMDEASPILAIRNSPKPLSERITISMPAMRTSGEVWLMTAGAAKADALGQAFADASPLTLPVAGVLSPTTCVYLDEATVARAKLA